MIGTLDTRGPPDPPQHLGLGGSPTIIPDVPVDAVFLSLFTFAAIAHMCLFQVNLRKRRKKFAFNAATFGFCFTRIVATSLRIAWACFPQHASLGVSAQIFVHAGIPVLVFCNLFWAQRIVRAQHPHFGWSTASSIWLPILTGIAIFTIVLLISAIVVQSYITDGRIQNWTRGAELYGVTFFAITAMLPIPVELLSTVIKSYPTLQDRPLDNFGYGTLSSKIIISTLSACLLSLSAWYRAITSYLAPLPTTSPSPWYFSKPAFYLFNFSIEILVVLFWLFIRIDKRFIVPNGARGPYTYANGFVFAGEPGNEKQAMTARFLKASSPKSRASSSSHRSSTATLPPPSLSRADSWASLYQYMSYSNTPIPTPTPSIKRHPAMRGDVIDRVDSALGEACGDIPISCDVLQQQHSPSPPPPPPLAPPPPRESGVMGFDPRTGKWDIWSVSVYSDREDLRPGSSLVTSEGARDGRREGTETICHYCRRCGTCGAKS